MGIMTFGVVVDNRGFFPDILAKEGRQDILDVLRRKSYGAAALSVEHTHYGAVNLSQTAAPITETLTRYLGWDVCRHG